MGSDEDDSSSAENEDLGDIRVLKNLLELQSRLQWKTDSIETVAD